MAKLVAISFTVNGEYRGGYIVPFFAAGAAFDPTRFHLLERRLCRAWWGRTESCRELGSSEVPNRLLELRTAQIRFPVARVAYSSNPL